MNPTINPCGEARRRTSRCEEDFPVRRTHATTASARRDTRPTTVLMLALFVALFSNTSAATRTTPYLHPPSVDTYARHNPQGVTILSNGRHLTPVGRHFPLASWPYGLAMSRDGRMLFIASDGVGQLVRDWQGASPIIEPVAIKEERARKQRLNTGGVDFSPDGRLLYWSGGEAGCVFIYDTTTREPIDRINANTPIAGRAFQDSYLVDLKVSGDGKLLFAADVTNFRLVVIDTETRKVTGSVAVGRYPYALAIEGPRVHVANIGLFEYSAIPEPNDKRFDSRGVTRPPFGFPSREARDGVEFEGRKIPGLGEPNVPESFSVWTVDISNAATPTVISRLKTGWLIGAPADNGKSVGGSAPNFLVTTSDALFVSNGNNDLIERIDLKKRSIETRRRLAPSPLTASLRGVGPAGMTVSPDSTTLFVAEMGINAIAVVDAQTLDVRGHIPTAWYPYRLTVSPDGRKLACICFRGFGNGPNAGAEIPASPFLGLRGVLSILDAPAANELAGMTSRVLENNGLVDRSQDRASMASPVIPTIPGVVSKQIKHVVFIAKENHTYDTVFDRIPGARHDPSLLRWGLHQRIEQKGQPTLEDVAVMVNHNALAREFTVSDNFYMEPEASGVGHRWLVGVQPNNLMQMTYSVGWRFKKDSTAPGRRYSMGSNGSLIPEDYPEAGSMRIIWRGSASASGITAKASNSRASRKRKTNSPPARARSSTFPCPKCFTTTPASTSRSST